MQNGYKPPQYFVAPQRTHSFLQGATYAEFKNILHGQIPRKHSGSFPPGGMHGVHSFRMGNRVDLNLRRFA
jgi:hypothetical protein